MRLRSRPPVQSVTTVRSGLSDDIHSRTRNYLISMAIRSVCLLAAVVATGPARWVLVTGAIVLPYFAVVAANAGRARRTVREPEHVEPTHHPALDPSAATRREGPSHLGDDR